METNYADTVAGILLVATGAGMCVVAKPSAE